MADEKTLENALKSADITVDLHLLIKNMGWGQGMLAVSSPANAASVLQEARQGVEEDITARVREYAGRTGQPLSQIFPPYVFVPVEKKTPVLGTYQRLIAFSQGDTQSFNVLFLPTSENTKLLVKDTADSKGLILEATKGTYATRGEEVVYDITSAIEDFVAGTGLKEGTAFAVSQHTTASVMTGTQANLLEHLAQIGRIAPFDAVYVHNDWSKRTNVPPDESKNGASHVRTALTGNSAVVIVTEGKLRLNGGSVYLIDHDAPRKGRGIMLAISQPSKPDFAFLKYT